MHRESAAAGDDIANNAKIADYASKLVQSAYLLRHPTLFRDCVIAIAGNCHTSKDDFILSDPGSDLDDKVKTVILKAINQIKTQIADTQRALFSLIAPGSGEYAWIAPAIAQLTYHEGADLPCYYRQIMEMAKRSKSPVAPDAVAVVRDLMQNLLTFRHPSIEIGTPLYNRSFLSIEIDELPW